MICRSSTQMLNFAADDVDVGGGIPVGAGVRAVGIAERDVDAGIFLVLQDLADDMLQVDVGADGEFADAVAVLVGVGVLPEIVSSSRFSEWASVSRFFLHPDGERSVARGRRTLRTDSRRLRRR